MGRFINADGFLTTEQGLLSNNMFAYCLNNPISRTDYYGTTSVDIFNNELDPTDDDKEYGTGRTSNGNSRGTVGKGGSGNGKGASSEPKPNVGNGGQSPQNANVQGSDSTSSKIRTPDQQALHDLAREIVRDAHQGKFITQNEAQLLDSWAEEYGVYQHHKTLVGSGVHWRTGWDHTHIYNIHVPFATCH